MLATWAEVLGNKLCFHNNNTVLANCPSSSVEDLISPTSSSSVDPWQKTQPSTIMNRRGKIGPMWKPIAYRNIKGLRKTAKNYGKNSSFFKNPMQATFSVYPLTPQDLKHVMNVLLSSLEFTLWEKGGRDS